MPQPRRSRTRPPGRVRTCVISREMRSPQDLVHFYADEHGVLQVDRSGKADGRGIWLLPEVMVLKQAEKRAGQLAKALKLEQLEVQGLVEKVQLMLVERSLDLLSLASRAGQLSSGADQLASAVQSGSIRAIVVANDAAPGSVEKMQRASADAPLLFCVLPVSREQLGQKIGKGPRAMVGLREGSVTASLNKALIILNNLRTAP